jgi:DNA-binding CsgD family transcriptional regulator
MHYRLRELFMRHQNTAYDLNGDLLITRYQNGIQLVKTDECIDASNSIQRFYEMPVSVYFVDTESTILGVNRGSVELNGLLNENDMKGKKVSHFLKKDFCSRVFSHDHAVISAGESRIYEEIGETNRDIDMQCIAVRLPWYYHDKLIGIFGLCGSVNPSSLPSFAIMLEKLHSTGLLGKHQSGLQSLCMTKNDMSYYSKREIDVLSYVVEGKSARQIGGLLALSTRTIENYIANIKQKSSCKTKVDLVFKFSKHFLQHIQS